MQQFEQVISHVSACQLKPLKAGGDDIAVKDRNAVRDTISTVKQHSCHHSFSKERHKCLHSILYFIDLELLEEEFEHSCFVDDRIHDGLGHEDIRAFGVGDTDLLEGVFE